MRQKARSIISLVVGAGVAAGFLVSGCDSAVEKDFTPQIVVEAFIVGGEPLPDILITRTVSVSDPYRFGTLGVDGVDVDVECRDRSGVLQKTVPYAMSKAGIYRPVEREVALPGHTYILRATVPGEADPLEARTTVPGDFQVVRVRPDTVVYQGVDRFVLEVTPSAYPGRSSVMIISSTADDPGRHSATPFYNELIELDSGDDDDEFKSYLVTESSLMTEADYDRTEVGTLKLSVPWQSFAFYGKNTVTLSAVDDNVFDLLRSQSLQQNSLAFSPGEIPNGIDHVEGGTGIFGSLSRVHAAVVVVPE